MQIHELPDVTAIGSGGYFATDDGSQTTKIDYDALAKAIIEQYSASTLAGSAQSVKAALDGINNKETWYTIPAANTQADMLAAVDGWLDATGASHLSGYLNGGRATTFGLPVATSCYLDMYSNSANFRGIVAHSASTTNQATFVLLKENGEWNTTWIRIASNDANSMHFGTEGNLWSSSARLTASTDINQILTGEWFWSDATNRPSTNIPDNNAVRGRLWALDAGGGSYYCAQICYTSSFKWFVRYCTSRSSFTWTEWRQLPTRAEVDALSTNLAGLKIVGKTLAVGGSVTFTSTTVAHYVVFVCGAGGQRCAVVVRGASATGYTIISDANGTSNITVSASGRDLTITSADTASAEAGVYAVVFSGTVS